MVLVSFVAAHEIVDLDALSDRRQDVDGVVQQADREPRTIRQVSTVVEVFCVADFESQGCGDVFAVDGKEVQSADVFFGEIDCDFSKMPPVAAS